MQVPDYKIIKDYSNPDLSYRNVSHVRYKTGEEYKCYKITLRCRDLVNLELAQSVSRAPKYRWISILDPIFPRLEQFTDHPTATQAELDFSYLIHAYTLLLKPSGLWKYFPGFSKTGLFINDDAVYIFQKWIPDKELKCLVDLPESQYNGVERRALVDAYLTMFEELHSVGLCFYDVILGTDTQKGNIYYSETVSSRGKRTFQCVWIDVESIMRPTLDADKTRRLVPAPYSKHNRHMYDDEEHIRAGQYFTNRFIQLDSRMGYPLHDDQSSLSNSVKQHGWSADVYLCLCALLSKKYLYDQEEFQPIVDDMLQLPHDSLISPLDGPLTYRLSEKKVVTVPFSVEPTPNVKSASKSSSRQHFTRRAIMVLVVALVGLTWYLRPSFMSPQKTNGFTAVGGLYEGPESQFIENMSLLKSSLLEEEKEGDPTIKAMTLFLSSQLPNGQNTGMISCPIRTEYPRPKNFHKIYTSGHCADLRIEVTDLWKQHPNSSAVNFVKEYFDLANCINLLGSSKPKVETQAFCLTVLSNTHETIMKSNVSDWATAELSLLWMSIANTDKQLIAGEEVLLDDVCMNLVEQYDGNKYTNSLLHAHQEFAINRCLINAGPSTGEEASVLLSSSTLIEYVVEIRKNADWTKEEWYDRLTDNRGRAYSKRGRRTTKLQEAWAPDDIHSFYSWLALSFANGEIAPFPDNVEETGLCVLDKWDLFCDPVEDQFGWVEMKNAMRKAGFKRQSMK